MHKLVQNATQHLEALQKRASLAEEQVQHATASLEYARKNLDGVQAEIDELRKVQCKMGEEARTRYLEHREVIEGVHTLALETEGQQHALLQLEHMLLAVRSF